MHQSLTPTPESFTADTAHLIELAACPGPLTLVSCLDAAVSQVELDIRSGKSLVSALWIADGAGWRYIPVESWERHGLALDDLWEDFVPGVIDDEGAHVAVVVSIGVTELPDSLPSLHGFVTVDALDATGTHLRAERVLVSQPSTRQLLHDWAGIDLTGLEFGRSYDDPAAVIDALQAVRRRTPRGSAMARLRAG